MGEYRILLSDDKGHTTRVTVSASDESQAIRAVSGPGKMPIRVEYAPEKRAGTSNSRRMKNAVLEFTEMMDVLSESGLSLKDSLEVASSIAVKSDAGHLASLLRESVQKGSGFPQAVDAHPEYFPEIYRGMIAVGDRTGSIEKIFPQLASYLRDRKTLSDKISGALAYPIMVMSVVVFGSIGLAIVVLPRIEAIFAGFGGNATIQIKDNIRNIEFFFIGGFVLCALIAVAGMILHFAARTSKPLALFIDRLKLSIPFAGKFLSSLETLNFAFAMETLAAGGVPVESAIEEAARVVINEAYRKALLEVREELLKGSSLSTAFPAHKEFPAYMSQWMAVGERSGKTERVFSQIKTYFKAEVEQKTSKIMTLVEPALIIVIGIFILVLVAEVILPLFSLYGTIL